MTTEEINRSIESMKLHLNKGERIKHWVNFLFILIPLSFLGFTTLYLAISNGEIPILGIIAAIAFFYLLRQKLTSPKLDVYKSELTAEQFKQANQAAARLNEWVIVSNGKDYFSAIKGTLWQWDGIKITAIQKNGKLYLNSMVNPSIRSNPFTFGYNKKNKLELIRQYQSILNGEDVTETTAKAIEKKEKDFWEESEWTIGKILMRIVGYGIMAIFLLFGILFIYEGAWEGIIPAALSIGIGLIYVKSDIQVIREKNKKKKLKKKKAAPNS